MPEVKIFPVGVYAPPAVGPGTAQVNAPTCTPYELHLGPYLMGNVDPAAFGLTGPSGTWAVEFVQGSMGIYSIDGPSLSAPEILTLNFITLMSLPLQACFLGKLFVP